ncbi:MAG TPA: cyclopropane-fatty-acyl-phospholipid synthase family protein [Solirubrobacterales bacterium]|nr:cyclopropane-fatty-acyl-phospholipid synthase family protein [Solirubrobacterales bacterium]
MPGSRTAGLRRSIERALPDRPFTIELWDGSRVPSTRHGPTVTAHSPRAIGHVIRARGELGLGRAYVCGELDVDDLDGIVALLGRWQPPRLGLLGRLRLTAAAVRAAGVRPLPPAPAAELRPSRRRHTKRRDAVAVRHHYDVSNDFFALSLDETMTYSCALFQEGTETLEDAQRAKLDLICRKLELKPGMRMLDIGCGWGSLAIHAAREYGASVWGITLSEPQAELARERARDAGVEDRVEIRVMDYRDLREERFDAIASIGMVEHVGVAQIDDYAARIARALEPGGRVLNHGITRVPFEPDGVHIGGDFSNRYVFPDGELLNIWRMTQAFERAGLEPLNVENLHTDYAETLRHWTVRFEERLAEAEELAGTERTRVWRLYLRAARNAFETAQNAVYQLLCSAPLTEGPAPAPTGARHGEARRRVPPVRVPA